MDLTPWWMGHAYAQDPSTMIPQSQNHPLYPVQVEAMQGSEIVSVFADLGGTLGALGFASWLCVYLLKMHDAERQQMREAFTSERARVREEREKERAEWNDERKTHLDKDSNSDAAMVAAMEKSQSNMLEIIQTTQTTIGELSKVLEGHSHELKASILELKMAIATNFDRVHQRWDGEERRATGNGGTSSRSRKSSGN